MLICFSSSSTRSLGVFFREDSDDVRVEVHLGRGFRHTSYCIWSLAHQDFKRCRMSALYQIDLLKWVGRQILVGARNHSLAIGLILVGYVQIELAAG